MLGSRYKFIDFEAEMSPITDAERTGSNLKSSEGLLSESQGQELAVTIFYTPNSIDSGWRYWGTTSTSTTSFRLRALSGGSQPDCLVHSREQLGKFLGIFK